jgi:hypothetical protein
MGTISFLLPDKLPDGLVGELGRACVAGGPDNMPWPTEVRLEPGRLTIRRSVDESGYLVVPWDLDGVGRLMGSSATLMERTSPYQLQVELARGKVNQVRCQLSDWRAGGLQVGDALEQQIHEASMAFGRAVIQQPIEGAGPQAQTALVLGYQAADQLIRAYADQVFQIRHQRQPQLDTLLGCLLGQVIPSGPAAEALARACNSVTLGFTWGDVQPAENLYNWQPYDALLHWAQEQGFLISGGPLIDFSPSRLPEWLAPHEGDLAAVSRYTGRYVEAVLKRYRSRIRRWQLTHAANWANVLGLSEDELLWLTVRLAEAVKQIDPSLELSVGVAQPWGEYMAVQDRMHSPFIFADTLIRSGLNLASLDVELVMGVTPRGSYARDPLEVSRLLDLYALLGAPLRVTLGYPSAEGVDSGADPGLVVSGGHWRGGYTPEAQAAWAADVTALVMSKPYVQGVQWVHLSDEEPHQFPHAGLVDASGQLKPAWQPLQELRQKHLR